MAGDWQTTTIGDLCDQGQASIQTGPFGSQLHAYDYRPVGVPVVPTEAIGRRIILNKDLPRVAPVTVERLARHQLRAGDILFARRGVQATGLSALVTTLQENWLCGTGAIRLRIFSEQVDPVFLSFLLAADSSIQWFKNQAVGAVMPNLNEGVIRRFPLLLPPVSEQRAIAHILSTLDDKIELNRRMNETLETIVRALFKSWFVDFDPVRAKTNGHQPAGIDVKTAAQFPDGFEDSPLGEKPNGWEVSNVGGVASYLSRGIQPAYVDEGGVLVINQKCIRDHRINIADARRHDASRRSINGRELQTGDVLVNSTGVGTLGRVAQVVQLNEAAVVDSHVTVVRADPSKISWNILGLGLIGRESEIDALGEGSTGQTELNRERFRSLPIIVPPLFIQQAFNHHTLPLRHLISANEQESFTLANIRDALLPKLLSGKVRVY